MKKLLAILGAVGIAASSSATVVACGDPKPTAGEEDIDKEMTVEEMNKLALEYNRRMREFISDEEVAKIEEVTGEQFYPEDEKTLAAVKENENFQKGFREYAKLTYLVYKICLADGKMDENLHMPEIKTIEELNIEIWNYNEVDIKIAGTEDTKKEIERIYQKAVSLV